MRNKLYTLTAILLVLASCSSSNKSASRELKKTLKQGEVKYAVESNRYLIKVNRIHPRRGKTMDMKPSNNYIIVDQGYARINLGYIGRSYSSRSISAINMSGQIIKQEITLKAKGGFVIDMKVKQNNDTFNVNMRISDDGYCTVDLNHPHLDYITYSGNITILNQ